ncbi:Conidiation protein 6-domain-containing protein [Cladorrhinum samala]|uniref:Conidiation protein 6-domain-containing protein n=1 Tax=Cladorrhinum samala TaxID=585594 RepID=A0AAV9HIG1_9PEZI|nr:Conidiation protein 6-domain-containing protein [Cladorrhinum samala]
MSDQKDQGNVIRGHKATLNNPNVSDEAKDHSREVLESLQGPNDNQSSNQRSGGSSGDTGDKDAGNVARGLKASINNPRVSDEAKEEAKKKLEGLQ